jgi:hypothetical protein
MKNLFCPRKVYILVGNPCWKLYYSMENLILHLVQSFSELVQVLKRIRTRKLEYGANFTYVKNIAASFL